MRALLLAATAALVLSACQPGQAGLGASAELTSVFRFAEFPGARLIKESVYPASVGPFAMPGSNGSRFYETSAGLDNIRAHYEQLGRTHGWAYSGTDPNQLGYAPGEPYRGVLVTLDRDRFHIAVVVYPTTDSLGDLGGPGYYPYPKAPVPPPLDGNRTTPPPVSPSPEPSPSVAPTPTPTPYGGAYYMRVDGNVRAQ